MAKIVNLKGTISAPFVEDFVKTDFMSLSDNNQSDVI